LNNNTVIAAGDSGLCNRLKVFIYSYLESKNTFIFWPKAPIHVDSHISKTLKYKKIAFRTPFKKLFLTKNMKFLYDAKINSAPFFWFNTEVEQYSFFDTKNFMWRKFSDSNLNTLGHNSLDLMYSLVPKEYQDILSSTAQEIILSNYYYYDFLQEQKVFFMEKNVVGIHVRTWYQDKRREVLFDYKKIENIIKTKNDSVFFISSDSEIYISELKKSFPRKTILSWKDFIPNGFSSNTPHTMVDMLDLVLLSMCVKIFGSYLSTFSEVAWYLSGCKNNIQILVPDLIKMNTSLVDELLITNHPNYV